MLRSCVSLRPRIAGAGSSSRSIRRRRPLAVDGATDDQPDLRIRQKQIVIDDAPALFRGIDHVQAQPLEYGLLGGADAGDPSRYPTPRSFVEVMTVMFDANGPIRSTEDENTSMSISGDANTTVPIRSATTPPCRS